MIRLRLLTSLAMCTVLTSACAYTVAAENVVIRLDPRVTYQTMTGWEATAQAGQDDSPAFPIYKDRLFDMAVNDLGINRLRLEVVRKAGPGGNQTGDGFDLDSLDNTIAAVVLPMKQRLEAHGEQLFINVCVVGSGYAADPNGYAFATLKAYQHLQSKYGFVPNAWEVALEPDNFGWPDAGAVAAALIVAGDLLKANGFPARFIAPSNTGMDAALRYFDQIVQVLQAQNKLAYLSEFSYHRYSSGSTASLDAIASRAVRYGINTAMLEHIGSGYDDLHQDLKIGRNSAWQQYALAYPTADDGSAYYRIDQADLKNPQIITGSRTLLLRQYFRFIRSGATRIEATTSNNMFDPVAFVNRDEKYVVVVKAAAGGSFSIQGLPPGTYGVKYTTSQQANADAADVRIDAGQSATETISAAGVITLYARMAQAEASPTTVPTSAALPSATATQILSVALTPVLSAPTIGGTNASEVPIEPGRGTQPARVATTVDASATAAATSSTFSDTRSGPNFSIVPGVVVLGTLAGIIWIIRRRRSL